MTRGTLAGKRVRLREARADFDGHIAELLSKALSQSQLDQPLTPEDRDRVLTYLRNLGALDEQRQYRGSDRRGPESTPLTLGDLFSGIPDFYVQTDWSSQPAMMQVAGGMDRLPAALASRLDQHISYRAAVREIRQGERGVWVMYADQNGRLRRVDADYCVSTIPLPVLNDIQKDLSPPVQSAIAAARYDGAGKIGLQFKRRFWEQDDGIYGGRSWTDQEVGQIIYPSHGFHAARACWSAITSIFAARCASDRPRRFNGWRSNTARAFTRNIRRVRKRVLGHMGAGAVEPRLMAIGIVGGGNRAETVDPTGRPRPFCRRLHDRHELVDAGRVRIRPSSLHDDPPSRARTTAMKLPCSFR
jgi:hypothetical protein